MILPPKKEINVPLWIVKKTTQILKVTELYKISMTIRYKEKIVNSLEIAPLCFLYYLEEPVDLFCFCFFY